MVWYGMVWYHKGNVKPEEEWPTDEYWREHWSNLHGSEEEPDPGSFSDSGDEQEPGSCLEKLLTRTGSVDCLKLRKLTLVRTGWPDQSIH